MSERSWDSEPEDENANEIQPSEINKLEENQRSNSSDSHLADEIENFFGEMENELEEILASNVKGDTLTNSSPAKVAPVQPQQPYHDEVSRTFPPEDGWVLYYSQEGYPYYYNSNTQESEWATLENEVHSAEKDTVLNSLEGVSPSPNKRPLDTIRNMNDVSEGESPSTQQSNQPSLISTAKGSLSAATATATTYGKTLFAVAATTANNYLKQPTTDSHTNPYQAYLNHPDSVEVTISARSSLKVPFILKKGFSFLCTVLVKDYDLGIALRERKMTDGGGIEVDLHPLIRCSSGTPYNLADTISLQEANEIQSTRNIILVFDNSYSTFRSKSCIYRIRQIESSEINTLLDIPETVQFNEFLDESRGDDNELDQSTVTEQSTDDDDREGDQDTTRRLNRVELIPLSVASNQKLKVVEGSTGKVGEEGDEFHMSDFHTNDDESYQLPEDLDVSPLERNDDERDGEEM